MLVFIYNYYILKNFAKTVSRTPAMWTLESMNNNITQDILGRRSSTVISETTLQIPNLKIQSNLIRHCEKIEDISQFQDDFSVLQ